MACPSCCLVVFSQCFFLNAVLELLRRRRAGGGEREPEILSQQVADQPRVLVVEVVLRPLHRLHGQFQRRRCSSKSLPRVS